MCNDCHNEVALEQEYNWSLASLNDLRTTNDSRQRAIQNALKSFHSEPQAPANEKKIVEAPLEVRGTGEELVF